MKNSNNIPCDPNEMKSLSECINTLTRIGFKTQFKMSGPQLESLDTHHLYDPEDIKITNFYRFEGASNPSDNSILFAIETSKNEKGILVNAYGMYSDSKLHNFTEQIEDIEKRIR